MSDTADNILAVINERVDEALAIGRLTGQADIRDSDEYKHLEEAAQLLRVAADLFRHINVEPSFKGTVDACDIMERDWKNMKHWAAEWFERDKGHAER